MTYKKANIEIVEFNVEDVITTSSDVNIPPVDDTTDGTVTED